MHAVVSNGKVKAEKDDGVSNCYRFTIDREDHTVGNLLTEQLLTEERVLFAGYRIHHPLDDWIYIRVDVSDAIEHPADLVKDTVKQLQDDISALRGDFERQINSWRSGQDGVGHRP